MELLKAIAKSQATRHLNIAQWIFYTNTEIDRNGLYVIFLNNKYIIDKTVHT